jgi:hypothetical protein
MVMTPQQARMEAIRLKAAKPELQSVAVDDLVAQIMASESEAAPGAGVGALANLFPTKLSPASPAPMRAAELEAPKPTALIIPNAARSGPAIPVGAGPRSANPPLADWQKEHLARMQAGLAMPEGEAAPVVAAEVAPEVVAEAPEVPKFTSRFGPMLKQKEAELEQLKASVPRTGEIPPELTIGLDVLSREVAQLKGLVAAEEGAAVDPERAAILERQTQRLGREEELVEQARKRAPFDALIAGGAALAGARPGESFASALTRGLQAGSQAYRGALDAREASLQGIEERRDAFALQNIDAVQKARDEAIALQNAGRAMTREQMELAGMTRQDAENLALAPFRKRAAEAQTKIAETEALYGPRKAEADLASTDALTAYRRNPPAPRGGSSGDKGMTDNQRRTKIGNLQKERRALTIDLSDRTVLPSQKEAIRLAIRNIDNELADLGSGAATAAPAFGPVKTPPAKAAPAKPPVAGAKQAANGRWYVPDPRRPGKYLEVTR